MLFKSGWGDGMSRRNLSLSPREENVRDANPVTLTPLHFTLAEIKHRFDENMTELENQFDLADSLAANNDSSGCKAIWRSQIVFAEGLMDFYIHEVSKYCLYRMFIGLSEKSKQYFAIRIPLNQIESAFSTEERGEWFFDFINKHLCRDVYLASEVMKDQLNLIGIPFAEVVCKAFPIPDAKDEDIIKNGKQIISDMFTRRNEIAHQNDRNHATAEQNDISKDFVVNYINNVKNIVGAIYDIALAKETEPES